MFLLWKRGDISTLRYQGGHRNYQKMKYFRDKLSEPLICSAMGIISSTTKKLLDLGEGPQGNNINHTEECSFYDI